jgi:Predicted transcriptional regulator
MKFIEKVNQLQRVDRLIRMKATGTPEQLACRLEISKRTVFELIAFMKSLNAPIYYCHARLSYCYEYPVKFKCDIGFGEEGENKLMGGESFFWGVQKFCSRGSYICNNNVGNRSFAS